MIYFRSLALLALLVFVASCRHVSPDALPVQINVGQFAGQWDINLDGEFREGDATVDLQPGRHRLRAGFTHIFFDLLGNGTVRLSAEYDKIAAIGGNLSLSILTIPVPVSTGDYRGEWGFARLTPRLSGNHTIRLVPTRATNVDGTKGGTHQLWIADEGSKLWVNVFDKEIITIHEAGNAYSRAAMYDEGTIRFADVEVAVTENTETGIPWSIRGVTDYLSGDHRVTLVADVQYIFQSNSVSLHPTLRFPCQVSPERLNMDGFFFEIGCEIGIGPVVDQENNPDDALCSINLGAAGTEPPRFAQTLSVGRSGRLAQVDFILRQTYEYDGGDVELQIRNTETRDFEGKMVDFPGPELLGAIHVPIESLPPPQTPSKDGFESFDTRHLNIQLQQGDKISIVWTREPYSGNGHANIHFSCANGELGSEDGTYIGGRKFTNQFDADVWTPSNSWLDFRFRTYMD